MGLFDSVTNWMGERVDSAVRVYMEKLELYRSYRMGRQRETIKVKSGQPNDNLTANFVRLINSRSVTMLMGKGVAFDLEDQAQEDYIKAVWDANKQQILLSKTAMMGAESGTCYLKVIPAGMIGKNGEMLPRLVLLDSDLVTVETAPEDKDTVVEYSIRFCYEVGGKKIERKQDTEYEMDEANDAGYASGAWWIRDYQMTPQGKWELIQEQQWEYDWPPIIHWQNLPELSCAYGQPDVTEDMIQLQDAVNFAGSNIQRIIRYHAHPRTIGIGFSAGNMPQSAGVDNFWTVPTGGDVKNLEMQSDLGSSMNFLAYLKQSLMDISQTVDLASMTDRLGSLTNFGLRVLYQDALAKNAMKQQLYGDALIELNRRLLVLGGFANPDGGRVVWPDPLPVNEADKVNVVTAKVNLGVESKETAAKELGVEDWQAEQARIEADKVSSDNIGGALLAAFNRGQ